MERTDRIHPPALDDIASGREPTAGRPRRAARLLVVLVALALVLPLGTGIADAAPDRPGDRAVAESEFLQLLNAERARAGKAPLAADANLRGDARSWSSTMAAQNRMFHTSTLGADTARSVPDWQRAGENVGRGYSVAGLHRAFVDSPGHYANIVGDFTRVGVGVVYTQDRTFVTFRFAKSPTPVAAPSQVSQWSAKPVSAVSSATAETQVRRLYVAFFRRDPDAGGKSHWTQKRVAGYPLDGIADRFASSSEFRNTYGSLSDRDFVALVYRNVMDRDPDAGGLAYWANRLSRGLARGALMAEFSESSEFRTLVG